MTLMEAFEEAYKLQEAKELLRKDWRELNKGAPHATGFCYIAAEAAFHILGKKDINVFYAAYEEDGKKCTHWWLKRNHEIIDPTKSQYLDLGISPPYHLGKRAGFLTKEPSKRAFILMGIVKNILKK